MTQRLPTPVDFEKICKVSYDEATFISFLSTYRSVLGTIEARARAFGLFMERSGKRNPIDTVKSRIKSANGIREKLDEKGLPHTIESISVIRDIAGVRIICPFIDDVYEVENYFMSQKDMKLIARKDYIEQPKESGYRSLHLIMETPLYFPGGTQNVLVEIQIRTIAMELWGNIEHRLRYKMNLDPSIDGEILEKLVEYSQLMGELDESFKEMRELVEKSQGAAIQRPM